MAGNGLVLCCIHVALVSNLPASPWSFPSFILPCLGLRQARSWKSWGHMWVPGDGPDHPHLAGNHPCPSGLIHYWVGTSWVCPPMG
jgi:hypothetical protein